MTDELHMDGDTGGKGRSASDARANADGGARRRRLLIGIIAAAVVVLLAAGAWTLFGGGDDGFFDPNATEGQAPYKTEEEIQAELNRIVEEGMFNISIAGEIEFADGTSPGIAYIENVPGNRYHMKVTIALDDTGETVYETGGIAPGNYIEAIVLERDLPAGTYDATATFGAYNTETFEETGRAAAKIKLVVLG